MPWERIVGVLFKILVRPWLRSWARIRAARVGRIPWVCLTWGCIGLGSAGVVLPLLPTTPFILVAAWAAPKASPRLSHWLDHHPVFGPNLHAWRTQRAIPRKAKAVAVMLLLSSWWILFFLGTNKVVLSALTVLFLSVTVFILTRPDARAHYSARALPNKKTRSNNKQ